MSDDERPFTGPTIGYSLTYDGVCMAVDMWEIIYQAHERAERGEVRIKWDWNGMNARPYDMSFVPMILVDRRA